MELEHAQSVLPLRPRLHVRAIQVLAANLIRRGPGTAWEIYALQTRREWIDLRVCDRFLSREEVDRARADLFPGCKLDLIGCRRSQARQEPAALRQSGMAAAPKSGRATPVRS